MSEIEVESVQQRPLMPCKLYEAAIKGDEQVLIEMLGLEKEDGGDIIVPIKSPAESDHVNNLQSATFMGNTVLHVLCAFNHDVLASEVCKKDGSLLRARNKLQETPLHYAAKGIVNEKAIKVLLEFAHSEGDQTLKEVLRNRNCHEETALHVLARHITGFSTLGETIVVKMMEGDSEWACQVDSNGLSSLDMALATRELNDGGVHECMIRQLGHQGILSTMCFSPANKPCTSHATLESAEIAQKEVPKSIGIFGRSRIHIAASVGNIRGVKQMLKIEPSLAYLQDSNGLFPVHVAAREGHAKMVSFFMREYLDSSELVDHRERNFLHIAAEENMSNVFMKICKSTSRFLSPFWFKIIQRMINATDEEGNTPLHIASEKGYKVIMMIIWEMEASAEFIRNKNGLTAFDVSLIEVKTRMKNSSKIQRYIEHYLKEEYKGRESRNCRRMSLAWFAKVMRIAEEDDSTMMAQIQIIGLGAVLITTVAFSAAFVLPGGYGSNGSPLLAGKYLFKAFILANTLAFLQSFLCVLVLIFGGVGGSVENPYGKSILVSAMRLFSGGARCMVLSFGLGLYLVLAPVNKGLSQLIIFLTVASVILDKRSRIGYYLFRVTQHVKHPKIKMNDLGDGMSISGLLRFFLPFVFIFIFALLS